MFYLFQSYQKYYYFKFLKHKFPLNAAFFHKVSKMFPQAKESFNPKTGPGESFSHSHQLMLNYGIISHQHNGLLALLPLGLRAVEKLIKILDDQMKKAHGQKIIMPTLTCMSYWKKSGRIEACGKEIMTLIDRQKNLLILSPTHEEPVTKLVSQANPSSSLPLRLYQITSKFRDEPRPKHGLLRSREFLMKDMYTFDKSIEDAENTFIEICKIYYDILSILNVPFKKVDAAVGMMGGIKSHEFHIPLSIGEDVLFYCQTCHYAINSELLSQDNDSHCPNCKTEMSSINGIEVAHAFLLGTKYTCPFSAKYSSDKPDLLQMGCYGIGVTRLLAATLESLSSSEHLIWPFAIAPFKVCLIPPKKGSKEFHSSHWCDHLEHHIKKIKGYEDEVIVDDRIKQTIGKRLIDAQKLGYPIIIIIGKKAIQSIPHFEVFISKTKETLELTQLGVFEFLKNFEKN